MSEPPTTGAGAGPTSGSDALRAENAELRLRLEEAEETLHAIRSGEVDALVVGDDIYTLESVDAASNRLRKDVLAQMEDAVIACDPSDRVIYLNPAAERRYGVAASSALGRPRGALYREQWRSADDEASAAAALRDVGISHTRTVHVTDAGERFDAESTVSRLADADGRPIGLLAVVRDITERRRAEARLEAAHAELARRERQFATLVQNSPDIFARFDRDLRHVYVSPIILQHTGVDASAFIGKTHAETGMPEALWRGWNEALERVFRTGEVGRIDFEFETVDDGVRSYQSRLIPEFDAAGEVESVLSNAIDVTDRERIEAALRESQARLRFALDAAGVGEWELDLKTGEARHSLRHDQCFGYPQGTPHWSRERLLEHLHPADRGAVERQLRDAAERRIDCHFESRVVWPDGSLHWIEVHGAVYVDGDKPPRLLGIVVDATDRKTVEQTLRDADRSKDEFLATLAHELRNPLAPIRNALEIMRLAREPKAIDDARRIIERQLRQMVHLVDDLLDVSRITQGKVELRRSRVDVAAAIHSAVETSRPLIDARRHTLVLELPAASALVVDADLTRLVQIVSNLLNNAAKYTPEGGTITVTASRDGGDARVAVHDSGVGIPAEMLPRVFDMFAQVDRTIDRAQGGLGIGLALVRTLVELHGGTVRAHSDGSGHGSTFELRLPALAAPPAQPGEARGPAAAAPADAARVLVVDDNVDSAESLATMLELMGYEVRTAHDGDEALRVAESMRPAIVVLDIGLPRLSGHEVARRIRAAPWGGASMRLIALSGWGQAEDRRKSRDAGFDEHLVKPVDLDALVALLAAPLGG